MRIGISSIGYESVDLLKRVFVPWRTELPSEHGIKICFSHGCFEETEKLGFPIKSTDGTVELAENMFKAGIIDLYTYYDHPQKEYEMWTNNYLMLKQKFNIELLIMVNIDEIWTKNEILKLLDIVKTYNSVDFFKVTFKNYCIDYDTWVDDFIVPRVWFADRNEGLKGFYKDDLVEYKDGSRDVHREHMVIGKDLIFPKHYSWVGTDEYLKRKLKFQQLRYGICSYEWDYMNNKLKLNDDYYNLTRVSKPVLRKD